jgi:nitroreductase
MTTFEAIIKRGSNRGFQSEQISDEELNKILDAGEMAPIASKDYGKMSISVIQEPILLQKIVKTISAYLEKPAIDPLYHAPTFIIISGKEYPPFQFGNSNQIPQPNLEYINAGCIIENMMLAATDLNIGSVCITGALYAFTLEKNLLEPLHLSSGFRPLSGLAVGYSQKPLPQRRKRTRKMAISFIK